MMCYENESNLDRFLRCTTPVVPSLSLPKTQIKNLNRLWYPSESESVDYFRLSDFWDCFDEWSAYGAGVPILSETGETLVQYYVPYLSAIQIFTSHSALIALREETESGDSGSETCSEEWRWEGWSSSEEGVDHQEPLDRLGYSYLQYFERCTPYSRVPLMDKIKGLGERHAGLRSLRSVDLSPASWMAVAWYPIYHIPMNRSIKDLSTCFLTYHTLSSSFQDVEKEKKERISVGAFGMATYKTQGRLWDNDRLLSLLSVADSWLKQLRVHHHDFTYFTTTPYHL
ncbi:hypothetical protein HID58_078333 [Brassica napus]|uniref:(rape) hypothetical protein n=1 Tax=Brassica napus TaxID=3708 RepID=A0A816NA05_BRANA|nr:uncharacterized protein LOC106407561 [Brassica napus]KAH0871311.1 hypothetical protein HID58_078333 [Brassica napus]CAF2029140.1 unnamed protein product [Brassica napus]